MKLRERIIYKIENLRDENALVQLEKWLDAFTMVDEEFSGEEVNSVMDGYSQYKNGELLSEEDVNLSFEKWKEGK